MTTLMQQDLLDFEAAQVNLKKAKEIELELRKKVINHFRYGSAVEGIQHKSLEGVEIDIAITLKLNRKANKDALDAIWYKLSDEQKACIKFVPEVKVKEYKALAKENELGELVHAITETPGLASVKLKFE